MRGEAVAGGQACKKANKPSRGCREQDGGKRGGDEGERMGGSYEVGCARTGFSILPQVLEK